MMDTTLLHELPLAIAELNPQRTALTAGDQSYLYGELAQRIFAFGSGLVARGLLRAERVGVYLDKRMETVVACFGTAAAGGAFVPLNPLLKPDQVSYILRDCNVRILVT